MNQYLLLLSLNKIMALIRIIVNFVYYIKAYYTHSALNYEVYFQFYTHVV